MPSSLWIWIAGTALCVVLLTSCSDVVAPPTLGVYLLEKVNDEELPVSWQPSDAHRYTLVADTIFLLADDRYRRSRSTLVTDVASEVTSDHTVEWEGSLLVEDGTWVLLSDFCGPNSLALCVAPPTVHWVDSGLLVRTLSPPEGDLLFVPVG